MGEGYASLFADYEGITSDRALERRVDRYWGNAFGTPPPDAPELRALQYLSQRKIQRFNHSPKDVRLHSLIGKTADGLFVGLGQGYFWMGTVEDVVLAIQNWGSMDGSDAEREMYVERSYELCHGLLEISGIDLRQEHRFAISENEHEESEIPPVHIPRRANRSRNRSYRRRIAV